MLLKWVHPSVCLKFNFLPRFFHRVVVWSSVHKMLSSHQTGTYCYEIYRLMSRNSLWPLLCRCKFLSQHFDSCVTRPSGQAAFCVASIFFIWIKALDCFLQTSYVAAFPQRDRKTLLVCMQLPNFWTYLCYDWCCEHGCRASERNQSTFPNTVIQCNSMCMLYSAPLWCVHNMHKQFPFCGFPYKDIPKLFSSPKVGRNEVSFRSSYWTKCCL